VKVDYAPRSQTDLEEIAEYTRTRFGQTVAAALETYIRATVARIAAMPESGERIPKREGVRVVPLVRYPFRIFYSVGRDTATILHIRNTARRSWQDENEP
jgi:toxin ParE1/3/4